MKDSMRQREGRVKGRLSKFYAGLSTSETPMSSRMSYSSKSNFKLSMNLPDWNQIPSVVIFPINTKTLVIL